ncbi:MAG: ABC transporter permease [Chloroflexota bacterium]
MSAFLVLLRKELKEHLRTHRLLIVVAVFFTFGLGTPLLLNYMRFLVPAGSGITIMLPEFTAADAVKEYVDTVGQVGLIAAILIAMGSVAREREQGTAAMTLSKPVGCGAFVGAKLAALALTFSAGTATGAIGCYTYTVILFGGISAMSFLASNLLMGLYLLVCLAVTLMYSSLFKNQLAAGGLALVSLIGLAATSVLPLLKEYSPGALPGWAQRLAGTGGENAWGALAVSTAVVIVATVVAWQALKRKEL